LPRFINKPGLFGFLASSAVSCCNRDSFASLGASALAQAPTANKQPANSKLKLLRLDDNMVYRILKGKVAVS
jgi:hypothetical protein